MTVVRTETAGAATERYLRLATLGHGVAAVLLGASLILVGSLRLVLAGAGPDRPLPLDRSVTDKGIPIPAAAQRCKVQTTWDPDQVFWCLPPTVTGPSLARWYASILPSDRDTTRLRWCMEQHLVGGVRRSIWFDGDALVGYVLPSQASHRSSVQPGEEGLAVAVFRVPAASCPAPTRSNRLT